MPKTISFGELDYNLVTSMEEINSVSETETPFRMLLLGDFSGRGNRGRDETVKSLQQRKPVSVDRDTFDETLKRFDVKIELPLMGEQVAPVCIHVNALEDFHPDALYRNLAVFQALKATRESLYDPSAFTAFVEELQAPSSTEDNIRLPAAASSRTEGLLDRIIEQSDPESQTPGSEPSSGNWDSFLHGIVQPHLVAKTHPKQEEMIDAVDAAAGELMRMILHHEDFQAVEAAWRGISFLVSRLETGTDLKLFLLDVSKAECAEDLFGNESLSRTAFYKLLVEQAVGTAGGQPWSIVAGNYTFEKKIDDLGILGRMAKIAKAAGCSFVAAAGDRFLCENSLTETPDPDDWQPEEDEETEKSWQALRHIPAAANLGLCLPRFLLRLPYGADTDAIDAFNFAEMPSTPEHANYLWGNPCFAMLLLIGQAFSIQGRQLRLTSSQEINSLPLHVYKVEGESYLKPCAETMLSQRAAEIIIDQGLMPLLSYLNQDMARLGRFQSISDPPSRLAGPWE
jgi:type VI secretion system protein ImpC